MAEDRPIKVMLAVGQFLTAQGLRFIIQGNPQFRLETEVSSSTELREKVRQAKPDIVIMDRHFDHFFSENELEQNIPFFNEHKVLVITEMDKEDIYKIHKIGITGFITTDTDQREITEAIDSTAKGIKFFSSRIVEVLIELSFRKPASPQEVLHEKLSDREMEIFLLVASGKSTKEIADIINLSPHTIYTHRKNILKKLSCKNATELLNYAYNQGLMEQ